MHIQANNEEDVVYRLPSEPYEYDHPEGTRKSRITVCFDMVLWNWKGHKLLTAKNAIWERPDW
jgi:hypothetical protein